MRGWILDAYADYAKDAMVLWLWTDHGPRRVEDPGYRPRFYVHGGRSELEGLRRRLARLDDVAEVAWTERRVDLRETEPVDVLEVLPRRYGDLRSLAERVDREGRYVDYRLYDVDLRHGQRYFLEHDLLPLSEVAYDGAWQRREDPFALEYDLPDLKVQELDVDVDAPLGLPRFEDPLRSARLGDRVLEGSEAAILEGLNRALRAEDPDVLLTVAGDPFVVPYLIRKAEALNVNLVLGREPQTFGRKEGKSYFTYGKIVYKPGQYLLRGRLHLDANHFAHRESGFHGLAEMARLARLPPQEMLRLTPGTAITAMQVNEAHRQGTVVLWKKNQPESFKTAEELVRCDRGGFILEPQVGLHENIVEVDYASLYPNLMRSFNISPETIFCRCCGDRGMVAPGIGHPTCVRRKGLIPTVLEPLLERKAYYKRKKREAGPKQAVYEARDNILKWMLVCIFGYQGYKNARFGRIECHEAINAYARELLVRSMHVAEAHGYEVVHGIVDSLWVRPRPGHAPVEALVEGIRTHIGLPIDLEGTYKWIVFLPCKTTGVGALNRYYGLFEDGTMKLRGIEVRRHDTPPFVARTQEAMLEVFAEAEDAAGFEARIPRALDVLRRAADALRASRVPLEDLVLTKVVTKPLEEYAVLNDTVAILRQMEDRGFSAEPGESVRYVITDRASRDYRRKAKHAAFLTAGDRPDTWEYLRLLCRATETLLAPFRYTEEGLLQWIQSGGKAKTIRLPS